MPQTDSPDRLTGAPPHDAEGRPLGANEESVPRVSIIIPTYNRGSVLCETIVMALNQRYSNCELIVVDQSESVDDKVRDYIESVSSRLRYVRLRTPNLPAARNEGVKVAKGEIIVFVDDDVLVGPEYVAAHVRNYRDPSVGAVMGITLPPGDHIEQDVLEKDLNTFGMKERLADGRFRVTSVVGCNCSFRKDAFVEAGWADERFGGLGYCEDTDLALRVGRLGYGILLDPRVRLVHLALKTGGCGFRDPRHDERVRKELCRLRLLLILKHRTTFGLFKTIVDLWGEYRGFALYRDLLRSPLRLIRRNCHFAYNVVRSTRMCFEGRTTSHVETSG